MPLDISKQWEAILEGFFGRRWRYGSLHLQSIQDNTVCIILPFMVSSPDYAYIYMAYL